MQTPALAHTDDRLQIGRLCLNYSVTGDKETAWLARQRLDRILENSLRSKLNGVFDPLRSAGDGLWFVQKLEIDADIDLDLSDREIMFNWSHRFAQALQNRLLDEASSEVVYFSDYQNYLSRYVTDLTRGSASHAWYYQAFSGLRSLPVHMAILTALLQQPAAGQEALLRLSTADRARVFKRLTTSGAQRLLLELASAHAPASTADDVLWRALIGQLQQHPGMPSLDSDHAWLEALELYLHTVAQWPQYSCRRLADYCMAVLTLRHQALTLSTAAFQSLTDDCLAENLPGLYKRFPATLAERVKPLMKLGHATMQLLLQTMPANAELTSVKASQIEPRHTPNGGVFLLLTMLQELALEQWLESWPEPPVGDKQAIIRLLLLTQCLAQCQGDANTEKIFRDPVIRDLSGVPPELTARQVTAWLQALEPAQTLAAQSEYASWRLNRCRDRQVEVRQCLFARRRLAIVSERERGIWLFIRSYQPLRIHRLKQTLATLLPDDIQYPMLDQILQINGQTELDCLQLPASLQPANGSRWLLTTMAQGMLRDFAWRLPGFAHASPAHLRANFLTLSARLEPEAERWLVYLDRPVLNVVLSMTGMARHHFQLDWLGNQRIELYQVE